ncbi:MAG: type pilus assembly protein PilM [Candidatus Hydrogenedentota bacterium]|jgi:type IV pilus assembly protein PilM
MLARGRKKRLVLDIGSSAVRLCELTHTKNGYQLSKYVQQEFDSDPALDEESRKRNRVSATQAVLKKAKAKRKKAIFGVPGQSVFTRTRTLPPVPEYKVNQIVRYEIQQQIPFSLDQIAMDYQILDGTAATGYEVMMAAIKTDVVDKHVQVLEAVKRSVDQVDVCCISAYNWLKHTGEFGDQGECVALIDMGATTTDIVIEREGRFRFTRPLNFGGNDITKAIAAAFGANFQDAERMKRERGFAPTGDPARDGKGGEVIGKALQRFVSETMRSFAYFRSLPGGGQVHRVILCGGGACLRNIVPYLQSALGVEVRIAQPLAGLAITPGAQMVNERPEQACVALGLALRCCQPVTIEINLIPPRITELARQKEQAFYWGLSLATLALIMASIIPMRAQENVIDLKEIDRLKQFIAAYDPEMAQGIKVGQPIPTSTKRNDLQAVQGRINEIKSNVEVLDKVRGERNFWLDEFAIINDSRARGKGLWFSSMQTIALRPQRQGQPGLPGAPGAGGGGAAAQLAQAAGGPRGRGGAEQQGTLFAGLGIDNWTKAAAGGGRQPQFGRNPNQNDNAPVQAAVERQNAIRIWGYAESDEVINDFVQRLRNGERALSGGVKLVVSEVRLDNSSVLSNPWDVLFQAADRTRPTAMGGQDAANYGERIYSFEIDVLFERGPELQPVGKRAEGQQGGGLPGLPPAGAPPAGAPPAGGGAVPAQIPGQQGGPGGAAS